MDIIVRDMKEEDLPLIKKFTAETAWKWDVADVYKRELNKEEWTRRLLELFDSLRARENHHIFVAEDEKHAFLGYVWVGSGDDMITGKHHGFIYDVFVKDERRGKGIGKILLKRTQRYCREKGYSRILLMVASENKHAIQLYEKMGFTTEHLYLGKDLY